MRFALPLLLTVAIVAAGCGSGGKGQTSVLTATGPAPGPTGPTTTPATPRQVKFSYPRDLQRVFLVTCVRNGGTTAVCACTLHRLQERMPAAQFDRVANALQGKRKPPAALEAKIRRTGIQCAKNPS